MVISKPLVSVILPNYNHALYLEQRIGSILNQTFQDFELIILDDCSTDNSADIINKYKASDKVSHIVFNENNSGSTFLQWQKGFSLAEGKYIWIAESDDYNDYTFLEKLVGLLEDNPQCKLAYSFSHIVDENGVILPDDWDRSFQKNYNVKIFEGKEFARRWMLFNNNIYNASMAVFRKDVLDDIDSSYSRFKYSGDWMFWNHICIQGGVIRCCEKLNYFRQHTNKVTSRADLEGLGFIESKYVVQDLVTLLKLSNIQRLVVIGWFLKRAVSSDMYKDDETKKDVLKDIQSYFKCGTYPLYVYKLDKCFNFSSLDIKKNRRL